MKVSYTILDMPDGAWHWVVRLWEEGPKKNPSIHAAQTLSRTALDAFREAQAYAAIRIRQLGGATK